MARPKKSRSKQRNNFMGVRLTRAAIRRLDEFAEEQDLSRSQVVRAALNEFMNRRTSKAA